MARPARPSQLRRNWIPTWYPTRFGSALAQLGERDLERSTTRPEYRSQSRLQLGYQVPS